MDTETIFITILSSGIVAAIVAGLMNHYTQIRTIKESGLYAKRAEVLDEVMRRMESLDKNAEALIAIMQSDGSDDAEINRREKVEDSFNNFYSFFQESKHYLSKQLSDKIGEFCVSYRKLIIDFMHQVRVLGENPDIDKWTEILEKHQGELKEQKDDIADEFRKMIGVK